MKVPAQLAAKIGVSAAVTVAALVAYWEGYVPTTYADPIGIPTVCFGHTGGVEAGKTYTRDECEGLLDADLVAASAIVDRCIDAPNPHQRAALISFAFNVGAGREGVKDGLCVLKNGREPYIRRMANAGRWQEACDGLLAWTKAGGVELRGLVKRRQDERALCLRQWFGNVIGGSKWNMTT